VSEIPAVASGGEGRDRQLFGFISHSGNFRYPSSVGLAGTLATELGLLTSMEYLWVPFFLLFFCFFFVFVFFSQRFFIRVSDVLLVFFFFFFFFRDLDSNQLSGTIPSTLGNLTALLYL